MHGHTNIK